MVSKEDDLRSRLYKFYSENIDRGKSYTLKHFMAEGVPRSTIYDILQRFHDKLPASRKSGSGRPPSKLPPRKLATLWRLFNHKDGISQRQAAKKLNCGFMTINDALMKARKKKRIPQRTANQISDAKRLCGRLYRKFSKRCWVIDDESYFTLTHSTINGNNTFYTPNIADTPPSVKFSTKKKFEAKVLVWLAIGPNGVSQPLIKPSRLAINANYDENYVFWPDKASSHYANNVLNHLRQKDIHFVEKDDNPSNLPEARSIEDFWDILKEKVYANVWKAENTRQLTNRIKLCLRNIDRDLVQRLAEGTKKRIDHIRRHGVIESQ
uniref:Transposase n=1 Tax=Acrobeloides nanus TaxID=290746 RepID=A0A914DK72_9BILA